MKKKWSRKAALLLAAVTILTSLPTEYLYAAQTQETQDTVTPEEQSRYIGSRRFTELSGIR